MFFFFRENRRYKDELTVYTCNWEWKNYTPLQKACLKMNAILNRVTLSGIWIVRPGYKKKVELNFKSNVYWKKNWFLQKNQVIARKRKVFLSKVLSFFKESAFVVYSIRQCQQSWLGISLCYLITFQTNAPGLSVHLITFHFSPSMFCTVRTFERQTRECGLWKYLWKRMPTGV